MGGKDTVESKIDTHQKTYTKSLQKHMHTRTSIMAYVRVYILYLFLPYTHARAHTYYLCRSHT